MAAERDEELDQAFDRTLEHACPTCGGPLEARFTRSVAWTWCRACLRLARPALVHGPRGDLFIHTAAAA